MSSTMFLSEYPLSEHPHITLESHLGRREPPPTILPALEAVLEHSLHGIVATSAQGIILYASPSTSQILGYPTDRLLGQRFLDLVHPEDAPRMVRRAARVLRQSACTHAGECRCRHQDGSWRWLQGSGINLLHSPTVRSVVLDFHDVTAFKLREQELESFSYSVAHDLRTPLTIIQGYASTMLMGPQDRLQRDEVECLGYIASASQRMNRLLCGLLDMGRADRVGIRRETVDLGELARWSLEELRHSEPTRNVQFTIQEEGMEVQGDSRLLAITVDNLLRNAWKFTRNRDPARIEVGRMGGIPPVYYVRDNGAGFPSDQAGRLFGEFQRLHSRQEFEGTGVGLSMVKRIIHRHGGRIWAEGCAGHGATFYFALP